ncbi:MAG TPA: Rieske 2Fe-2S domain-containing protein [Ramlibacter sp.]|nr:Rieske 2Fe-2S domain-containing protein [Ramlibacter sp.]
MPEFIEDNHRFSGFPHSVMPTGWFQIGWSDALQVGDVVPLKYFKRELVLYRAESGTAVLLSAYCSHMGAHLGHGGTVKGEAIRCPFHGWEWDKSGCNQLCPAEGKPSTSNRNAIPWSVAESNGIIWAWHDILARSPLWQPPAERRQERNYLPIHPHCTFGWKNVRSKPQYGLENVVDIDHLLTVHRSRQLPEIRTEEHLPRIEEEGHIFRLVRKPPLHQTQCHGTGVILIDFIHNPAAPHRMPALVFANQTPIDDDHVDIFGCVHVEQDPEAKDAEPSVPAGNALKRLVEQRNQAERDLPIWENQIYLHRPAYTRLEAPLFMRIREFAKQFYPAIPIQRAQPETATVR